jgi:hypothetical protein
MEDGRLDARLTDPIAHPESEASPMKRLSLRRFIKATILAFAISTTIVPSALAMPLLSTGGSGATQAPSLGPRDGWNVPLTQSRAVRTTQPRILDANTTEGLYTGAPQSPALTSDRSLGRISPDVPPVPASVPVLNQPNGFDWTDASIGAAGGFVLTALLAAMALVVVRQRHLPLAHR